MASSTIPTPIATGDKWVQITSISPSNASIATFSSIATTYRKLRIFCTALTPDVSGSIYLRVNGDTTAGNYLSSYLASGAVSSRTPAANAILSGTGTNPFSIDLTIEAADQTGIKPIHGTFGTINISNTYNLIDGTFYLGSAAVTSLSIVSNTAAVLTGTIYLYGVLA